MYLTRSNVLHRLASILLLWCGLHCLALSAYAANGIRLNSPPEYLVPVAPQALAKGDFNGDGCGDIAVVTSGEGYGEDQTVSILLNKGDGTFALSHIYTLSDGPTSIVVADFNGDGKPDIVVSDIVYVFTAILFGNGDGTFQNPGKPAGSGGFLAAADEP